MDWGRRDFKLTEAVVATAATLTGAEDPEVTQEICKVGRLFYLL